MGPADDENERRLRHDLDMALGCAFAVAILVVVALIVYLWTL